MTKEINEVVFVYEKEKPLFRIHGFSGAIRNKDTVGGKAVFLQREHHWRFEEGKMYVCSGQLTWREKESTELFIPNPEPVFDPELDVKPSPVVMEIEPSTEALPKKPNKKMVRSAYFKSLGISLESPRNVFNVFNWAAQKGNLRLMKEMVEQSFNVIRPGTRSPFFLGNPNNLKIAFAEAKKNGHQSILDHLASM